MYLALLAPFAPRNCALSQKLPITYLRKLSFLLIIFKIGTLYSPLKLFFPISFTFFLTAVGYYASTYLSDGRFTNMGMLLFVTSLLVFLMGLVSEQITALMYKEH